MSLVDEKYARYGLRGNPFRTTTHTVESVSRLHANLQIDTLLGDRKEDVFFKRNRHAVFLVGDAGMGKTHRILVASAEATNNNLFFRSVLLTSQGPSTMDQFIRAFLPGGSALFSSDKWQRELAKNKKQVKTGSYNPRAVAQSVALALNQKTPSFLLIDDLDKTQMLPDHEAFLSFLLELVSILQPGVFVLVTMNASYASLFLNKYPMFQNLFETMLLQPLSMDDAIAVVSKWLTAFRLVDDLHPLFPFSSTAVEVLNKRGHGNCARLLDLSDLSLTAAGYQKAVVITDMTVKESLYTLQQQMPQVLHEKNLQAPMSPELRTRSQQEALSLEEQTEDDNPLLHPKPLIDEAHFDAHNHPIHPPFLPDQSHETDGDVEHPNDGREHDLLSSSFSESSQGDKRAVSTLPSTTPHPTLSHSDPGFEEQHTDQSLDDPRELTRMKPENKPLVSSGDNGSSRKSTDIASIMYQVREEQRTVEKDDHSNQIDESELDYKDETGDEIEETWEPVDSTDENTINEDTRQKTVDTAPEELIDEPEDLDEIEPWIEVDSSEDKEIDLLENEQIHHTDEMDSKQVGNTKKHQTNAKKERSLKKKKVKKDLCKTSQEPMLVEPVNSIEDDSSEHTDESEFSESEASEDIVWTQVSDIKKNITDDADVEPPVEDISIEQSKQTQGSNEPISISDRETARDLPPAPDASIQPVPKKGSDEGPMKKPEKQNRSVKKELALEKKEVKQHRPTVAHKDDAAMVDHRSSQGSDPSKRVLRVRCPECSRDFTVEVNEKTHSLSCPFCGFYGDL
jgi:ribosomal protein S27E